MTKDPENLTDEDIDDLFDGADDYGTYITEDNLPTLKTYHEFGDSSQFEDLVSAERLMELETGNDPTPEEMQLLREDVRGKIEEGDCDADFIPAYAITAFTSLKGQALYAVTMRKGYSFSEITCWLHGVFESEEEARRSVAGP
jgi:hypothetical protein